MLSDGGTDEVYWIEDEYQAQTAKDIPTIGESGLE